MRVGGTAVVCCILGQRAGGSDDDVRPKRCMRGNSIVSTNSTCSAQKKTYSTYKYAGKVPKFGHVDVLSPCCMC